MNWCPTSLLTCDYKRCARVLAGLPSSCPPVYYWTGSNLWSSRTPFFRDFLLLKLTHRLSLIAEDDNGKVRGACVRSRICRADEGEASILFFLCLEKQHGGRG